MDSKKTLEQYEATGYTPLGVQMLLKDLEELEDLIVECATTATPDLCAHCKHKTECDDRCHDREEKRCPVEDVCKCMECVDWCNFRYDRRNSDPTGLRRLAVRMNAGGERK